MGWGSGGQANGGGTDGFEAAGSALALLGGDGDGGGVATWRMSEGRVESRLAQGSAETCAGVFRLPRARGSFSKSGSREVAGRDRVLSRLEHKLASIQAQIKLDMDVLQKKCRRSKSRSPK